MPSFSIPLSGLQADSTALNTIANNLANMNTTAYKSQNVNFSDLFYQQVGSTGAGNPTQVGSGTQVSSISTDFTTGSPTASGNASDVALQGDGFFVVKGAGSGVEYTRNGTFGVTATGALVTQDGLQAMGYPATGGVVDTTAALVPLVVPKGQVEAAKATTSVSMTGNLNAVGSGSTVTQPVTVYDSLGVAQIATFTFVNTAPKTWTYSVTVPKATGSTTNTTGSPNTTGTLTFDPSGNLTGVQANPATTAGPAANVPGLTFSGLADGATDINFTWNLVNANKSSPISQTASASSFSTGLQDGYTSGVYSSFAIDSTGVVQVTFNNGQTSAVGQFAVAMVTNEQGLDKLGSSNYAATLGSGQASLGVAGTGGRGAVLGNNTEASNVDISTEFADLIVAQRAFEANSKAVTTFDTVAQTTINMIR